VNVGNTGTAWPCPNYYDHGKDKTREKSVAQEISAESTER
jgi:hypothetical protein